MNKYIITKVVVKKRVYDLCKDVNESVMDF